MRKLTMLAAAMLIMGACSKSGENEYQVETPDVDMSVSTDTSTVRAPDVDVGTTKDTVVVNRPTVDVNRPNNTKQP